MSLEEMSAIDPRKMDMLKLVQLDTVHIDSHIAQNKRCQQFIEQIKNPYCYMDGKVKVKISFTDTERSMDDCVRSYLSGI